MSTRSSDVQVLLDCEQFGRWADSQVKGLYIQIGPRRCVWRYLSQHRVKGRIVSSFKTLGYWPEMEIAEARKEALIYAGEVHSGRAAPGKRLAMKFAPAFEHYLNHLKDQAARRGKPPRWYANAKKLGDTHILPMWQDWTLYDMSHNPRAVATWHAQLHKKIPTSADHCGRLIRACYLHEARLDRTLDAAALPTSGIRFEKIKVSDKVIDFPDFKAWRVAWRKLGVVHRGFHLTGLLTGCRPGELARVRKGDVDRERMTLTLRNAKAGNDIVLPITPEILIAINLAANAKPPPIVQRGLRGMRRGARRVVKRKRWHPEVAEGLLFPGCRKASARSGLPVAGNALRHTFRSVAVSLGTSEMLIHFLMGHSLQGVSAKYTNELMILRSAELRVAQATISRRIFELLGAARPSASRVYYSKQVAQEAPAPTSDLVAGGQIGAT
jgi:integrase